MIFFKRLTGIVLVPVAGTSMVMTLFLLVRIWQLEPTVRSNLTDSVNLISATLVTTGEGLAIANDSLGSAQASVASLGSTLQTLAKSIEDTNPLLIEIETLLGEELPATISSTQLSLTAAQDSAYIIESVLAALTSIPFFGGELYNPEVPLYVSLGQVADNLGEMPASLAAIDDSLKASRGNLIVVKAELGLIKRQVDDINDSLEEAGTVIEQYQLAVVTLQEGVARIASHLSGWLRGLVWVLSYVFGWLFITQLALFFQGWGMLVSRAAPENRT